MLSFISERIKKLRTTHALSQKDFAQRIGISQPTLSFYEKGSAFPSIEVLINIARQFDVSLDWLCGVTQEHPTASISNLSDFIRCLFELDRTTNLRYEIEINNSNINDLNNRNRQAVIVFTDNDSAHPRNADIISFLTNFKENRQAFETYMTTKDQYEWWQKYALEKYQEASLPQKQYDDLPTERRIALRNALVLEEAKKTDV